METNVNKIAVIAKALLQAQMEMGNAKKDNSNPFFKSKYADLNSIREACMPSLNKYGIVVLQPTVNIEGKNFVKTLLLHESGESIECLTEIIYNKQNDAQAQGSGITYARRYGLQSLVNVGAEDDDGNKASSHSSPIANAKPFEAKPFVKGAGEVRINITDKQFKDALDRIEKGELSLFEKIKAAYKLSPAQNDELVSIYDFSKSLTSK